MSKSTEAKPVSDYSLLDPNVQSDPYEFYGKMHKECPVYQMPETGMYIVSKYQDLRQVLKDTDTFSSDITGDDRKSLQGDLNALYHGILKERGWSHVQTLQRTDPPEHSRYRKLLDRVFTAKRVKSMKPHIDDIVNELIDNWIEKGECEFNWDFAMPMPGIFIAEQLGLARDEIEKFKKWADAMLAMATKPLDEAGARAAAEIELEAQHYLYKVFEDRRANPQDDIISALVHAHGDDEEALSTHELQNLMHQLITGGFETTQSAIAHSMWYLVRNPEMQDELRGNPAKVRAFIEEILRFESPVQGLGRLATKDVEVGGTMIPKGAMVLTRYGAANHDEEVFECPHKFDMGRKNVGAHLAFGSGAHFCVGAMLARQEMISSVDILLSRLKNIRLSRDLPNPVHEFSLFLIPMKELPIKFDKV